MDWEEFIMNAGIGAVVGAIIGVIAVILSDIIGSKKQTQKLQFDHKELKGGQDIIQNTTGNIHSMLIESKVNQRRDFESLSQDQKELKQHMDKFQDLLHDWERQAHIIKELESVKQQMIEKNNSLEKKIDAVTEETRQLKKENAELKEKVSSREHGSGRISMKDISEKVEKTRNENNFDSSEDKGREDDRER